MFERVETGMKADLDWVVKSVKGQVLTGDANGMVSSVSTDSRNINQGALFIALKGERFDGHDYLLQVQELGARAVIVSRAEAIPDDFAACAILVEDTLQALQDLAAAYRRLFSIPVIGVTGSVGKTTTRDILALCLSSQYYTLQSEGNYNNEIGLPLTLLRMNEEHQVAVVELAMRAPGEIDELAAIAEPDYAIITGVEPVHLETMGSIENIARAKTEILAHIPEDGFALLNGDSRLLLEAAEHYPCRQYRFGFSPDCEFCIMDIQVHLDGILFNLRLFDQSSEVFFPVPAARLAPNVAAAVGMAFLLGISLENIHTALKEYKPSGSRLRLVELEKGGLVIDDSYNANPLSMQVALDLCRDLAAGRRKVAVLGDMFELGSYEKEGHWMVGQYTVHTGMDVLLTIGERARWIAEGAREAGMRPENIHVFIDRTEAQAWINKHVGKEDIVVFKASRGMHMEEILAAWMAED
ncbi:MAG TPA: UDP-N-acetylmuramoyl-tripeptide--D-alanyl-D-alanine ligase [Syntrophomonadaceae bacterium]|nr:UDP-N-acetylmuramoyl-tripeptide--D-alanyl-D-alanine ligase [Syntrophomonadaceae bacterium]